jgi:Flp pilus assembly protein TadD
VVGLPLAASNWLVDRAYSTAPERPQQALSEARLAGDLDPFGPRPALAEGQVALEIGDLDGAERAFSEAAARDSAAWYPRFELGLLEAGHGNRAVALGWLGQAAERNPRERLVDRAVRSVRSGRPLDPSLMARRVLAEAG